MQKLIAILAGLVIVAACNDNNGDKGDASSHNKKDLTPRNLSITRANAYSDIFLDSNAVEAFIKEQSLNDTVATGMRNFYNARNFQYAWFAGDGLTEQALAFRNLYDYSQDSTSRKALDRRLDGLMAGDSLTVSAGNAGTRKTELMLTWRYVNYVWEHNNNDRSRKTALEGLIPAQKMAVMQLADRELSHNESPNDNYATLKEQLKFYVQVAKKGGWVSIPATKKKLTIGTHDTTIVLLKKRLMAVGILGGQDTSSLYDDALAAAVQKAQSSYGFTADGVVSSTLIKELNIPVEQRIEQLLLNLERMRWLPAEPSGNLIWVNIPEFKLYVRDGKQDALAMNVVVGKEGHSTVIFSGSLNQVVFSPYWNLPENIVRHEVIPAMEKNKHYLADNNMEVTGEEDGVPVIRQLPGNKNQLGKIKFLFPNSFNIYFHDTPFKELFKKDMRAYSHGCIRLSEPVKLAQYLLQDQPEWTPTRIDSAMNSGKEKYVRVKDPVPVLIYYYTAWVDNNKVLQFRDDIYGHDQRLAKKLFLPAAGVNTLATR